MLIKIKGRSDYKSYKLKPLERLESLWEKNNKKSGDSKADAKRQREHERIYKELKNDT